MKYFLDTEFIEGVQTYGNPILEFWLGQKQVPKPTIDLISIGLVAEDDRQYYAISKDFNLKEAWNRYDIEKDFGKPQGLGDKKVYWLRENVLKSIFDEWNKYSHHSFTYRNMKYCIKCIGKTNKQIAEEIKEFCKPIEGHIYLASTDSYEQVNIGRPNTIVPAKYWTETIGKRTAPEFYGYYCDYDWVVFCWLFGKMIDLPKDFPCIALI